MDNQQVSEQLGGHHWLFRQNDDHFVRTGSQDGILALIFLASGELTTESMMLEQPKMTSWRYTTENQIQLLNSENEIVMQLSLPQVQEHRVVMTVKDSSDTFSYEPVIDENLNQRVIRQPEATDELAGPVLLDVSQQPNARLENFAETAQLTYRALDLDLTVKISWQSLYTFLIDHPNMTQVVIALDDYQNLSLQLDAIEKNTLYVDDALSMIALTADSDNLVQQLDFNLMIGWRPMLLEWISTLLELINTRKITSQQLNQVAYQYFPDRLYHGRQVTEKPGIISPESWLKKVNEGI
ncbi:hypothetical protein [Levilactobacillus bambusae]|uniref:Uncharacterized protein n=1 Tax=Levilactobacillus bambusae TaxID=2024736 RepID=A0A2V1MXC4_9LACO|nr:hypothetical protein [Levilactobacillus bambusae]PWF99713.1 hypothetical protein DCM90_06545 [Levilactobacillus bambusae]